MGRRAPRVGPGLSLATVGVAVSVGVTAAITVVLLDFSWGYALLLAAVISSTDAAAVFATLRRLPLPRRMAASLEAESGLNDAPAILLVAVLAEQLTGGETHAWWVTALEIVGELLGGAVVGLVIGFGGVQLLRRSALPLSGFYPLATLALCVLAFSSADLLHTSGFVAVYLCGLVLGNASCRTGRPRSASPRAWPRWPRSACSCCWGCWSRPCGWPTRSARRCSSGARCCWSPVRCRWWLSLVWFRFPWAQQLFISWAGLRGAVPIVLATFPLTARGARRGVRLRHRVRAGRRLHAGAGLVPALGRPPPGDRHPADAPRRRGRVRAVGRARRRPDADDRAPGPGCTACTCRSCACRRTPPWC